MLDTSVRAGYRAFGMSILSEISLPELVQANIDPAHADFEIIVDPFLKQGFHMDTSRIAVEGDTVTMMLPDAGVFRMIGGTKLIVSPFSWTDEDIIRLYILGTCMGIVMLQRTIYPLHGSAVVIEGNAYAFIGESGAGKSTLASAFVSRGYKLLTDDIIPVSIMGAKKQPVINPTYPQQKLWRQSLDAFGVDHSTLRPIHGRETKYCVSALDTYCTEPIVLAGLFELLTSDDDDVHIQAATRLEKLPILFQHTFRQFLVPRLNLTQWHFRMSALLGEQLPIYRIHRPTTRFTAPQLVDLVLNAIHMEG